MQDSKENKIVCDVCKGEQYVIEVGIVPYCCGFYTADFECCNNPIPVQEPYQVKCEKCSGTGYIKSN